MSSPDLPFAPLDRPVILVVDDEALLVTIARTMFERDGYFVLTARDGEEALEISRAFPRPIDALVADVKMPGIGGIELRRQILRERPGTKVLLMSAFVDQAPIKGCPFLRKPFDIAVLKEQVRQLLAPARPI